MLFIQWCVCVCDSAYVCVVVFMCVYVLVTGLYKVISKAGYGMICRAEITPFMDVECPSTRYDQILQVRMCQ